MFQILLIVENLLGGGKRKASRRCLREQLKFMSVCKRGDSIQTADGEGILHIVDPFNRCLHLEDGGLVNLCDVILSGMFIFLFY